MTMTFAASCSTTSVTQNGTASESSRPDAVDKTSLTKFSATHPSSTIESVTTENDGTSITTASTSSSQQEVFFPKQRDSRGARPDARAYGKLTMTEKGCLRLSAGPDGYPTDLLIWPADYSLQNSERGVRIVKDEGSTIIEIGDVLEIGGGGISASQATRAITENSRQELPERCPPPYFLMSGDLEIVRN